MGWLYDVSLPALIVFSVGTQRASVPFFFLTNQFTAKDSSGAVGV